MTRSRGTSRAAGALNILVVEDRPDEADLLVASLEQAGYDVRWRRVETRAALEEAMTSPVDVVVAGVEVASCDVSSALDYVRSLDPDIPFVAVSGSVGEDVAVDYLKRGVSDWVVRERRERLPMAVAAAIRERSERAQVARAAQSVQESERRLAHAQQIAGVGSWEWDVATDTLLWSDELYTIYGQDPSSFRPSFATFLDRVHPEDRERVQATITEAFAAGHTLSFDHRIVRGDGAVKTLECRGDVERNADGAVVRMTGSARDVSDARARELALAETLRRLGEARALARIGNWELELDTGRVEWSDEMWDLYGVERGSFEPTLDGFCRLLSDDEAAVMRRCVAQAQATGEGWENDIRMVLADGRVRVFHGHARVECDGNGRPVRIRGTRQDVSAMRSREAQLREAEERFRLAFDEAPIGVALVALDGRWLRVNRALSEIVGYRAEEMLRLGFQDITHPDDVRADMEFIRRLLAGEIRTNEIEKRYIHAQGHVVWIQLNVSLARDDAGEPLYFITQIQDITERKSTEGRMVASEARFRGLLESAPDAMVIVDADGHIVLVNRRMEQMFGYTRDELMGQPVEMLIPEKFRHRHAGHRAAYVDAPQVRPMGAGLELFGVRADGTEFPLEISLSPLETDSGRLVSAAIRDITERKHAESIVLSALKRERELTERLRELDRIKNDFVATVSHELRTPLTNIIGMIELLADGDFGELSSQQNHVVDVLDRNSHRLLDLIKDLLDLNQIESGGLGLQRSRSDLRALMERAHAQVVSLAESKKVTLEMDCDGDLGGAVVDSHQLERALVNVLTNAVKFTPSEGRVTLRAERTGPNVHFVVTDNGIGIPEDEQRHLFTRFFRSSIATEKAIPGSGLGLVIVKSIVEGHDGTIDVESTLGEGTTVTISLPVETPVALARA